MKFNDMDALERWLTAVPIDLSLWGKDGAKTVADLWQEIVVGETQLQADPLQRQVQVAQFLIRRDGLVLMEGAQELADGQRRERGILPAEKMKAGERVETAVLRGLREELNLAREEVKLISDSYQQQHFLQDSPSYPGLPTLYTIHSLAVEVQGLSDDNFWRDNAAHQQGDPVKRHYWVWQPEII